MLRVLGVWCQEDLHGSKRRKEIDIEYQHDEPLNGTNTEESAHQTEVEPPQVTTNFSQDAQPLEPDSLPLASALETQCYQDQGVAQTTTTTTVIDVVRGEQSESGQSVNSMDRAAESERRLRDVAAAIHSSSQQQLHRLSLLLYASSPGHDSHNQYEMEGHLEFLAGMQTHCSMMIGAWREERYHELDQMIADAHYKCKAALHLESIVQSG